MPFANPPIVKILESLQWSHREVPVNACRIACDPDGVACPLQWSHREVPVNAQQFSFTFVLKRHELQWSHREVPVNAAWRALAYSSRPPRFNGVTGKSR